VAVIGLTWKVQRRFIAVLDLAATQGPSVLAMNIAGFGAIKLLARIHSDPTRNSSVGVCLAAIVL